MINLYVYNTVYNYLYKIESGLRNKKIIPEICLSKYEHKSFIFKFYIMKTNNSELCKHRIELSVASWLDFKLFVDDELIVSGNLEKTYELNNLIVAIQQFL